MTRQGQRQGLPAAPARAPLPLPRRRALPGFSPALCRENGRKGLGARRGRQAPAPGGHRPPAAVQRLSPKCRRGKASGQRGVGADNGGRTLPFPPAPRSRRVTCRAQAAGPLLCQAKWWEEEKNKGKKRKEKRRKEEKRQEKRKEKSRKGRKRKEEAAKLYLNPKQRGEAEQNSRGYGGNCGALAAAAALLRGCPGPAPRCPRRRARRRSALLSPSLPRAAPAEQLAAMGLELCKI